MLQFELTITAIEKINEEVFEFTITNDVFKYGERFRYNIKTRNLMGKDKETIMSLILTTEGDVRDYIEEAIENDDSKIPTLEELAQMFNNMF